MLHFRSTPDAIRVPRAFEATLPPEDSLMDDIVLLRHTSLDNMPDIQARGQDVLTLWVNGHAHRAAQTPAQPALAVGGKTLADLQTALAAVQPLEQVLATQRGALSAKRSALRSLTVKVDRNNKRWYLAWQAEYLPGTPENDALSLIDTGSPGGGGGTPPPPPVIPAVPANVTLTPGAAASALLTVGTQLGAGTVQVKLTPNPGAEQTTLGLFATLPQVLSFNPAEEVTLAVSALNGAGKAR